MPVQAVAIVVYEGVQALDVAGPMDVFSEANTFVDEADRYETVLIAAHRDSLRASNGIRLVADLTFEEAAGGFDIILVAGAPTPPEAEPEPYLVQWVKELPRRSSVYGSICTGVLSLAMPASWTIGESQPIGKMHRRWRPGFRRQKSNRT
jgi:transcriptional regulator GlxA family with amidase domain